MINKNSETGIRVQLEDQKKQSSQSLALTLTSVRKW